MAENLTRTRLSLAQKRANNNAWFRQRADQLKGMAFTATTFNGEVTEWKRKKVNYDLFNGIIDARDFEYVCKPFGAKTGELPASFGNKDIVSSRIKALLGMEMKRPFSWRTMAVNEEATTRKEEEEFQRIKDYVVQQALTPVRQEIEMKYQKQAQGRELTEDEKRKIQEQIAQELDARTPDQVRRYMQREHQDPAEAMHHQILQYLVQNKRLPQKFNTIWKHAMLAGEEVAWVGIHHGEPDMYPVNSLRFDYDKSPDNPFIEDGEWAVAEYRWTPSQVVGRFGKELTNSQIDEMFSGKFAGAAIYDDWSFADIEDNSINTIPVYHCTWKDLRGVGFLEYLDQSTGKIEERVVDESYTINKDQGDISISWEWIPEAYETYIIGNDIYVGMGPVGGQFKDLEDLYTAKLPYYGAAHDNLNSQTTALMDRMKGWQYYFNIVMYRIELLMASDKGKLLLMNINSIPKSSGIDIEKWMYYAEALKIGWVNPSEEGNKGLDVTNMAKEINMSLVSDIQKYIELATYIEEMCGKSVGITDPVIGEIAPSEAVTNSRQNLTQTSYILEPYFNLHNHVKRNILQALIEQAKIAWQDAHGEKLTFFLDDLSMQILTMDVGLLNSSTIGVFVADSGKAQEVVDLVKNMSHAAMQNDAINMSDVVKVIRADGIQEAEEQLAVAEEKKRKQMQASQLSAIQEQGKNDERAREFEREKMEFDRETLLLQEEKRTERELAKQAMLSVGFNEDKDADNDGELDVLEIYKKGKEVDIKERKQNLDEEKFQHQKQVDKEKIKLENKKLNKPQGGKS